MNKTSRVCVTAALALSTLIEVTVVENSTPTSRQARVAIAPYHTHNGYIGNDANFILNKNFINVIKYNNVKFNGIKLAKTNAIKKVEKYDQTLKGASAKENEAGQLQFIVKNNVSLKDIRRAYGKDLKKENGKTKEADSGIFYYQDAKKILGIWLVVDHNRIVEVTVGHTPYKASK